MIEPELICMSSRAIGRMKRLRLVMIRDMHISGCPEYLSNDLRWLNAHGNESLGSYCQADMTVQEATWDGVKSSEPWEHQGRIHEQLLTPESSRGVVIGPVPVKMQLGKKTIVFLAFKCVCVEAVSNKLGNIFYFCLSRRCKQYDREFNWGDGASFTRFKTFSAMELLIATKNFSGDSIIGLGGFGDVYFGILDDGRQVAIKRAMMKHGARFKDRAFAIEIGILSRFHHKNIVTLLGFMETNDERALVLEYMPNGSLSSQLHFRRSPTIMYWMTRIRVARDAARGLHYLHNGTDLPIIHRDVKSSNILLDFDWTAKISDFGVSGLTNLEDDVSEYLSQLVGTKGYIAPEHYFGQRLTSASDVYGFGIVLLELISGRMPLHRDETGYLCHITDLIVPLITRGELDAALDPSMTKPTAIEMASITDMAYLATECVSLTAEGRPSMSKVLSCLSGALARLLSDESDRDGNEDDREENHTVGR